MCIYIYIYIYGRVYMCMCVYMENMNVKKCTSYLLNRILQGGGVSKKEKRDIQNK